MGGLASTVGSMVGIGGSAAAKGMNWEPGSLQLQTPVTTDMAQNADTAAQTGLTNQANFLTALQGQNGIGNQSSVYNQLQGVANGTGPNPAQAMLAQSTGANVANQAALMAGQRGAGSNVGLIARQAGQQGMAAQQQAAGQAATMQANQSLNALGQLGGLATQQVGQQAAATGALTGAQQSEQQLLLNQVNAQNSANLSQQQGLNSANQAQAAQGAKAQAGVIGGIGSLVGLAKGGPVRKNYADGGWSQVGQTQEVPSGQGPSSDPSRQPLKFAANDPYTLPTPGSPQAASSPQAQTPSDPKAAFASKFGLSASQQGSGGAQSQPDPMTASGGTVGNGIAKGLSGIGSAIGSLFGGSTPGVSATGEAMPQQQAGDIDTSGANAAAAGDGGIASGIGFAKGGKVPAMVSPGERYLPPNEVKKVAEGKKPAVKAGEKIPGKAKVKGDDLRNDTVRKTLEEGGIVLPKSVMESKNPHWEAHKFVSAIIAKQGLKGKKRA